MAGDPDLDTSAQLLLRLQEAGADIIELGIPYSDPLADGPVIQAAAARALRSGTTPADIFQLLNKLQNKLLIPVVLFTYSNPLIKFGIERFCDAAASAGASGFVVPDLPLEEAEKISPIAASYGLDLILLVAPTTPSERMKRVANSSSGFTYLVSVTGVTGERSVVEDRVQSFVQEIKGYCSTPVAVGFGISGPEQVHQVRSWGADGVIIGSALVKRIASAKFGNAVQEAENFCRELRKAAG